MEIKEMIEKLRYKANSIKAHIEPEFFNDVADRLEEYEKYKLALYKVVKLNKVMPVGLTIGKTEKEIIDMRFGLGEKEELTQKQVADKLGISQSYISRLEKRIIKKIGNKMKAQIK